MKAMLLAVSSKYELVLYHAVFAQIISDVSPDKAEIILVKVANLYFCL